MQTQVPGLVGKYKFGVKTRWGSGSVNTNLVLGPVNTNWGPEPGDGAGGQANGQGPSKGPGTGKMKHPNLNSSFKKERTF